ncbi:MAG: chemotaxis response regulator protein-glutamate methylesterase [Planctomycetota bacterium]
MSDTLKVLVVDDTALYRKLVSDLMNSLPGVEVVGSAPNGKIALDRVVTLCPDVITLDIEMPVMDGLDTLRNLKKMNVSPSVVMVSSHSKKGAAVTMDALHLGAFDFITKPEGMSANDSRSSLLDQLRPVVAALRARAGISSKVGTNASRSPAAGAMAPERELPLSRPSLGPRSQAVERLKNLSMNVPPDIVAIAISTGGPQALGNMIPRLPAKLRVPIVIAQHIPAGFSAALADSLDRRSALTVMEGKDGQVIEPGCVYIAPGGKQMKVVPGTKRGSKILKVNDDPPENHCKPSADYLMRSVAQLYGNRALGVIMTGMGNDGVKGLKLMKRHGVTVIAQDQASSVVFGMPMEAIKAGLADVVAPLDEIANEIVDKVGKSV